MCKLLVSGSVSICKRCRFNLALNRLAPSAYSWVSLHLQWVLFAAHTHTYTYTPPKQLSPILQSWGDCPLRKSKHVIGILPASGAIQNSDPNFFHSLLGCKLAWCYWTISLLWNGDASNVNRICVCVCVLWRGYFCWCHANFTQGPSPRYHGNSTIVSSTKTHIFLHQLQLELDVQDSCTKGIGFDPQRNIWEMCAKVFGWEVDKLWSCYCLVSMESITEMDIYMSNFQNLRNRRYYISGHQVSRSVSKSSGTIGSTRKKRYLYRIYAYMWDA